MSGGMRPTAENWSCGFELLEGAFVCAQPATWHGFRLTYDGSGIIASMMACCDPHKERMVACADFVHPMGSVCGLPGSRFRWPENECYMDLRHEDLLIEAHDYPCDDEACRRCPVIRRQ